MSSALAQPSLEWDHRYPSSSPPSGLADKAIGVYSDGTNVYAAGTKFKGSGNSVFNVTQYEQAGSGGVGQIDSDIEWPADTSVDRQVRTVTATDFYKSTTGSQTISLLVGIVPGDTGSRVAWAAFDNQNTSSSGDLRMLWSRVDDPDYDEADYNEVPVSVSIDPSGTSAVAAVQITHGGGLKEIVVRIVAMSDGAIISTSSFAPTSGAECVGAITTGAVAYTAGTTTVSGRKRMFILGTWHTTGAFLSNSPLIVNPGSDYDLVAVKSAVPFKITENAVWDPFTVVAKRTDINTGDTDIYTSTYTSAVSGSATNVVAGNLSQYWDGVSTSGIDYDEPVDIAIASYRQTEDGDEALARPHVFVCGTTRNGSGNTKIVALQYQEFIWNSTLMPRWLEWYNVWERGTSQDHVSHAITFSLAGSDDVRFVHVTGASKNSSGNFDYVTLKYLAHYEFSGETQTNVWGSNVPIWAGPAGNDHSYGIWANWLSNTPNFYSTGSSYHSTTADDWVTLRYTDP